MGAELKALGTDRRAKKQVGPGGRSGVNIMCRCDLAMHFKGNKVRDRGGQRNVSFLGVV